MTVTSFSGTSSQVGTLEMIKPEYGKPIDKQTYDATLRFFDLWLFQEARAFSG